MTSQIRRPLFASRPPLQSLLSQLHKISLDQERAAVSRDAPVFFPKNWENPDERKSFDDKLVALDEDKASAMYLILRAMNAQRFFEAGTSFGVSTLYLLAALRDNLSANGPSISPDRLDPPCIFGSELSPSKVVRALQHIDEAFSLNNECAEIRDKKQVDILEGDLLQEIPKREFANGSLDGLLLDIWAPVALPTLRLLEPALRLGAVLFIDNTTSSADRYAELLAYIEDPANGWKSVVLPFTNGFEMAVKAGA